MRYTHPREQHQADAVKRLEVFNAAKEIAEFEKQKNRAKSTIWERAPTFFPTVAENVANSPQENPTLN